MAGRAGHINCAVKLIATFGFLAITAAAGTTVWFVAAMKPTSAAAFAVFCAWLISPHAAMAAALALRERKGGAPANWYVVAIIVCAGGALFLANMIFWRTDAQGALAVLMAPLFQGIALVVLLPLTWLAFGPAKNREP